MLNHLKPEGKLYLIGLLLMSVFPLAYYILGLKLLENNAGELVSIVILVLMIISGIVNLFWLAFTAIYCESEYSFKHPVARIIPGAALTALSTAIDYGIYYLDSAIYGQLSKDFFSLYILELAKIIGFAIAAVILIVLQILRVFDKKFTFNNENRHK